jgi:hypothetical protein
MHFRLGYGFQKLFVGLQRTIVLFPLVERALNICGVVVVLEEDGGPVLFLCDLIEAILARLSDEIEVEGNFVIVLVD